MCVDVVCCLRCVLRAAWLLFVVARCALFVVGCAVGVVAWFLLVVDCWWFVAGGC